ncbi:unnamed protein product [Dibothriocephalus latus]|uniref:Uncharacterized protein n=1 Tax=Dibothriocephalus latus TaxID=60516 RepID=A0A3P7MLY9_DIBLA|nr:unnamed protein product [Dibothriocephalus latus]
MSLDLPEAKPDTMEEIFSDKCQRINLDHYSIYHFDELVIDDRKYQYRLSSKGDVMTLVGTLNGQSLLLVSVWTNMDHENRLREIHQYILQREAQGDLPNADGKVCVSPPTARTFAINLHLTSVSMPLSN